MKQFATYQVALKLLLRKGDSFLFVNSQGKYDLPGGRIDDDEHYQPLEKILDREIKEELGSIKYKLYKPLFQFRRHNPSKNLHVMLTVYEGEYLSGEIEISNEHQGFEWLSAEKIVLKMEKFFSAEELEAFKTYFEELK